MLNASFVLALRYPSSWRLPLASMHRPKQASAAPLCDLLGLNSPFIQDVTQRVGLPARFPCQYPLLSLLWFPVLRGALDTLAIHPAPAACPWAISPRL